MTDHQIEEAFHAILTARFLEAKERGAKGDFNITITAEANVNSREIKIESRVRLGNWQNYADAKARTVGQAFPVALTRAAENEAMAPKLLTVQDRELAD
jgi:hypothetical protein